MGSGTSSGSATRSDRNLDPPQVGDVLRCIGGPSLGRLYYEHPTGFRAAAEDPDDMVIPLHSLNTVTCIQDEEMGWWRIDVILQGGNVGQVVLRDRTFWSWFERVAGTEECALCR